jgi:predicted RNase H-like nuclease (RuvC/YqgF family)
MGKFIPVDPDRWAELVKAAGERDALVVEVRRLDAEVARLTDLKSTADRFEAENARLKAECQARQAENSVLAVECDSLKAEVERLTKHSTDFVRAEMYRHLLDENAKLKEEVMRMRNDDYKEGDILQKCCEHQKNRIERLKAEVERLEKTEEYLQNTLNQYALDDMRLQAEVERLTKAGDAMAKLLSCCGNPQSEVRGWNAAKEVQS